MNFDNNYDDKELEIRNSRWGIIYIIIPILFMIQLYFWDLKTKSLSFEEFRTRIDNNYSYITFLFFIVLIISYFKIFNNKICCIIDDIGIWTPENGTIEWKKIQYIKAYRKSGRPVSYNIEINHENNFESKIVFQLVDSNFKQISDTLIYFTTKKNISNAEII